MKLPFVRVPRSLFLIPLLAVAAAVALRLTDTNLATAQTPVLTAGLAAEDPGLDPDAAVWQSAQAIDVPLTAQTAIYPAGGSIPLVRAQAVHFNDTLFVRVAWQDDSADDLTDAVDKFADAVALEFPAQAASTVPAVCMGQADAGVNIWYWRADSNRGPLTDLAQVHEGAVVDSLPYTPEEADRFFPARKAGNPVAYPNTGAVQNLVARAFGTLTPAADQAVQGLGKHDGNKWIVVIVRPFASANPDLTAFQVGDTTDMAVAVWNGSQRDRNGQKAVSQFMRLSISDQPPSAAPAAAAAILPPAEEGGLNWPLLIGLSLGLPIVLVLSFIWITLANERRAAP